MFKYTLIPFSVCSIAFGYHKVNSYAERLKKTKILINDDYDIKLDQCIKTFYYNKLLVSTCLSDIINEYRLKIPTKEEYSSFDNFFYPLYVDMITKRDIREAKRNRKVFYK
jgi:hypothetical protein